MEEQQELNELNNEEQSQNANEDMAIDDNTVDNVEDLNLDNKTIDNDLSVEQQPETKEEVESEANEEDDKSSDEVIKEEELELEEIEDKDKLEAAIEAILFTMGDSVSCESISKAVGYNTLTIKTFMKELIEKYQVANRGIQIIELEDSYQMCTKKEMYEYLIKLTTQPKKYILSDILLETLSIIAYKQPVTKIEIEKIRGVGSGHSINKLIEIGLVEEVGRADGPGKPYLFGTSEEFLRKFSISSIEDLPEIDIEQLEILKQEAEDEINVSLNA